MSKNFKKKFSEFWVKNFGETVPISYLFKSVFQSRWLRVHNLPNSKRYADNHNEMRIILERQNKILSDSLLPNEELYLVARVFPQEKISDHLKIYNLTQLDNKDFKPFIEDGAEDEMQFYLLISRQVWRKHKFDSILSEIADDKLDLFFVSLKNKIIFAPYDGGMDIIYTTTDERNTFKEKYKNWLSARADGL